MTEHRTGTPHAGRRWKEEHATPAERNAARRVRMKDSRDAARADVARLRAALEAIERYKAEVRTSEGALRENGPANPYYALGRIAAEASIALRGHAEGPEGPPEEVCRG